jgi:hypothetical protein
VQVCKCRCGAGADAGAGAGASASVWRSCSWLGVKVHISHSIKFSIEMLESGGNGVIIKLNFVYYLPYSS